MKFMAARMTTLCKKLFSKWFKKKSYIRFYSNYEGVVDLFPVIRSSFLKRKCLDKNLYPDDVLPTSNCPGIRKVASAGFIITAPADFEITTNGDGVSFSWTEPMIFNKGYPGTESYINSHISPQVLPTLNNEDTTLKSIVKIETPWRIDTSDDIVFLQMPVSYNNESRFEAAVGIMDPKYSHTINVQIYWKILNGKTLIKAGTPLCQYIPINRKELNLNDIDVSVDYANENDQRKERSYNYAANCVFLDKDSLSSRLTRAQKVLTKYKL
jgi:hypothetical protein